MMKTMKMRNRREYKADAAERVAGSVSKKRRMDIVRTLLVAILLLALPSKTFAQWGFDVASVEAYINDHKKQRSLLLARSTLEYSNKLLHSYSKDETKAYKELNVDLDKYTRAFDVIDVLYQSLRTSLNVYSTYEGVSDRISDYKKLLDDYNKKPAKTHQRNHAPARSEQPQRPLGKDSSPLSIHTARDDQERLYVAR